MDNRPAVTSPNLWIAGIVLAAVVVAVVAVTRVERSGRQDSSLGDAFDYPIEAYRHIDPALIKFDQVQQIASGLEQPRAVAVGPEDRIYVAGDRAIRVFEPGGAPVRKIALDAPPRCLAVAGPEHAYPGRIYVGMDHHVEVLDQQGQPEATWEDLGRRALLTSIAVADNDVFVADAGGAMVMRYDTAGHLAGRIGGPDAEHASRGFAIPSPFFDVAVSRDGLLDVANPGALRIETYSFDGHLEGFWGEASSSVEGFFGCCNPAHFALLPDGRFVTAEKGLLRVKTYTADGTFDGVVAGPEQLDTSPPAAGASPWDREFKAVDVAADSRGRVMVLDPAGRSVRIYKPRQSNSGEP